MSQISKWLQGHALQLTTIAPEDPLDDLEPLREIIGNARVVALGEGAHFIKEFWTVRQRLIRFLHDQLGFNIIAAEIDVREGESIDDWLKKSDSRTLLDVSPYAVDWGMSTTVEWLRTFRIHFVGLDAPNGGESFNAMLQAVAKFLYKVDPDSGNILELIEPIATTLSGTSVAGTAQVWAALGVAKQDALTAGLSRLRQRMHALEAVFVERSNQSCFDSARRQLDALICSDYALRANEAMHHGTSAQLDLSMRDRFMADSLLELLEREPNARVVILAHNGHIQKEPVVWDNFLSAQPMGFYLHNALGNDYRVIGTTTTDNHTSEMDLDPTTKVGFTVRDTLLKSPEPGSIEAALIAAGLGTQITLTELQNATNCGISFNRIRAQSGYLMGDIAKAYDCILVLPTITIQKDLGF